MNFWEFWRTMYDGFVYVFHILFVLVRTYTSELLPIVILFFIAVIKFIFRKRRR
jgi:hypothetical protein